MNECPQWFKEDCANFFLEGAINEHLTLSFLENDLLGVLRGADENTLRNLKAIHDWMTWELPARSYGHWGDKDSVQDHLNKIHNDPEYYSEAQEIFYKLKQYQR